MKALANIALLFIVGFFIVVGLIDMYLGLVNLFNY